MRWVENKISIDIEKFEEFVNLLLKNEITKFTDRLNQCLLNSTSHHDLQKERDHHNLMGGLFISLSGKYRVSSNKEPGDGRYDHSLVPEINNQSDTALLLEYKTCQKEVELQTTAKLGLNQIEEKRYETEIIKNKKIKKIMKACLVFGKKRVMEQSKIEEVKR